MKRFVALSLIAIVLFISSVVVLASITLGDYGYTYDIGSTPGPISRYNVMGEVEYINNDTESRFQTYAVRISGTPIPSFTILKLNGRVWWQGEIGCPLHLYRSQKQHWTDNVTGYKDVHYLDLPHYGNWPTYSTGKHKIEHPNTISVSTGQAPKKFFVSSNNVDNQDIYRDNWKGIGLGCSQSPVGLPTDDPDDD